MGISCFIDTNFSGPQLGHKTRACGNIGMDLNSGRVAKNLIPVMKPLVTCWLRCSYPSELNNNYKKTKKKQRGVKMSEPYW